MSVRHRAIQSAAQYNGIDHRATHTKFECNVWPPGGDLRRMGNSREGRQGASDCGAPRAGLVLSAAG
jgi:hypothetical protein